MSDMYGWTVITRSAADPGACFEELDDVLKDLASLDRLGTLATIVLSPFLQGWNLQQHGLRLKSAFDMFAQYTPNILSVLGMPSVDVDGQWSWPLRHIRRQYWKLTYSSYPTGSARYLRWGSGKKLCHGGDSVSGSRIYRSSALRELLQGVDRQAGASWLVNLDLEAHKRGFGRSTFLCTHGMFPEEDYLPHADLTAELATRYEVEAAIFDASVGLRTNCAFSSRGPDFVNELISRSFLVAPWCFRRVLRDSWQKLARWWHGLATDHYIVASDGTGLALFRNLHELIPWDTDIDARFFAKFDTAANLNDFVDNSSRISVELKDLGFTCTSILDYSARGAGIHVALTYDDEQMRGGPVLAELDIVIQGHMPKARFPLATKLAGVSVRLSQDLQDLLVRKYSAPWKQNKMDQSLVCLDPSHNACVPNCTIVGADETPDCEFPDRFVEIDFFEQS
mmetsp:Transcript_55192/g.178926  ORF Transcript_55192/g.178926 Transcript_55192/m.178926 type:complete len:452 (-) Transcript_55192:503-1858(-)